MCAPPGRGEGCQGAARCRRDPGRHLLGRHRDRGDHHQRPRAAPGGDGRWLHTILDVAVDGNGKGRPALIKDMQLDPVRDRVIHIDLHEIRLDQKIQTVMPVHLEGHAEGVKMGGALSQPDPRGARRGAAGGARRRRSGRRQRARDRPVDAAGRHQRRPRASSSRRPREHRARHHRGAGLRGGAQVRGRARGRGRGGRGAEALPRRARRARRGTARARKPATRPPAASASVRLFGASRAVAGPPRGRASETPGPSMRHPSQPRIHGRRPAGRRSWTARGVASSRAGSRRARRRCGCAARARRPS